MRKAKETWIEEQCQGIEENLHKNNSKKAFQKELTSSKQGRTSTIQDKPRKCLTKEQDILKRWTEYCSELYAHGTWRNSQHRRQDNYLADDIDGLAGQEQKLEKLVNHLEEASTAYGVQISAEKTQLMTYNTNGITTDTTIDNKKLEIVRSFKYLGATVSDEGSKPEVLSRTAQTTVAVTKLKVIWNDKNIASSSKIRLMRSLIMSIFRMHVKSGP